MPIYFEDFFPQKEIVLPTAQRDIKAGGGVKTSDYRRIESREEGRVQEVEDIAECRP